VNAGGAGLTAHTGSLFQQIIEFWMLADIGTDEGTFGHNLQPLGANDVERAARQRGSDATGGQFLRNLCVGERNDAGRHLIVGDRRVAVGIKLEAMALGVVADGVRQDNLDRTRGPRV